MSVPALHRTRTRTLLGFRPEVRVAVAGDVVTFRSTAASFGLRGVGAGVAGALERLAARAVPLEDLLDPLDPQERLLVKRVLDRTEHLLVHTVVVGTRELLRLESTAVSAAVYSSVVVPVDARLRMSRFAFLRSRRDELVLESPLSSVRVVVLDTGVREMVAELGAARCMTELAGGGLSVTDVGELVGHLVGAGLVDVADHGGAFLSETDPVLRQWDFHDLLMHGRARSGRYDDPFGAVYPHRGLIDPQPAVRPPPAGPVVDLYRPSWSELEARDPSLTAAIEGRRSVRDYADAPMTLQQLGEFLYRVGRVRAHYIPTDDTDEVVSRPYPSGGRSYELELWLTVRRCAGLAPGIYCYDPVGHRLVLVNDGVPDREALMGVAARATGTPTGPGVVGPDVLVTMTARFQRVSWKYGAIAYATTLRHTGVLYQTMYLVATAMGLAACGLGNGDADISAKAFGLDYLVESSVGEFLLGSRRPDDVMGGPPPASWHLVNSPEWPLLASAQLP
jgi:SagB-type dehydrogenase family enzyme